MNSVEEVLRCQLEEQSDVLQEGSLPPVQERAGEKDVAWDFLYLLCRVFGFGLRGLAERACSARDEVLNFLSSQHLDVQCVIVNVRSA